MLVSRETSIFSDKEARSGKEGVFGNRGTSRG